MSTIREIIAAKSTAAAGSTIRQHFAAPAPGGGVSTDPGDANVLAGVAYTINDVGYVGRRVFPVAPQNDGEFSLYAPLETMRNMLLGCQAWADLCGGPTQAIAQTFLVSAPARSTLPHCIIDYDNGIASVRDVVDLTRFQRSAAVAVYFSFPVLNGTEEIPAEKSFLDQLNSVITFLENFPTFGGMTPAILSHDITYGPRRTFEHERDKYGDAIEVQFSFRMSVQS